MQIFENAGELAKLVGSTLGPSEWLTITQEMIDGFARSTGDDQWIHVDPERAKREAPGGKTIAHGFLTLSLIGRMQPTIYSVKAKRTLNYGLNKLRFLNAVPVGSRVRLIEVVKAADAVSNGLRITNEITIEIEGAERPALVAEILFLYFD